MNQSPLLLLFIVVAIILVDLVDAYQVPTRTLQKSYGFNRLKGLVLKVEKTDQTSSFDQEDEKEQAERPDQPYDPRTEISQDMRKKLLREIRATGGDPNYSAGPVLGNPVLLISIVIAILVVAAGKGIFY